MNIFIQCSIRKLNSTVLACACFSGATVHNVYTEEEEESESASSEQQTLENSITMSKMKLLKAKMENMNLNKKVTKQVD